MGCQSRNQARMQAGSKAETERASLRAVSASVPAFLTPVKRRALSELPFARVFAELHLAQSTGRLMLQRGATKKLVYMVAGEPVAVRSNLVTECLGEIMVADRMITPEERDRSVDLRQERGVPYGQLLVETGSISERNLDYALDVQAQRRLLDLFSWRDGDLLFLPEAPYQGTKTPLSVSMPQLVFDGVARMMSEDRIRRDLKESMESVLEVSGDARRIALELMPESEPLIQLWESGACLGELLTAEPLNELVRLQLIYTLLRLHLLVPPGQSLRAIQVASPVHEAPPTAYEASPAPEPETPSQPASPVASETAPEAGPGVEAARDLAIPAARSGDTLSFEEAIELLDAIDGVGSELPPLPPAPPPSQSLGPRPQNPFEALGLNPGAPESTWKSTYRSRRAQIVTDLASATGPSRAWLEIELARLDEAYRCLVHPKRRFHHEARLGLTPPRGDRRLLAFAAKRALRRALSEGDLARAETELAAALSVFAEDPELLAAQNWLLWQQQKPEVSVPRLEALASEWPNLPEAPLYLGRIHEAEGDAAAALSAYQRCVQADPDQAEAWAAIHRIRQESEPKRGLLSRFGL